MEHSSLKRGNVGADISPLLFALDMEEKRHIVGDAYRMYLLKLTFLVLLLAVSLREADAFGSGGDERFSHPTAAVHVKGDTSPQDENPVSPEQGYLRKRFAQRQPDAFVLSFAAQNVPPSINGRSFGCLYRSCLIGEADFIALYQFLRVYRC